MHQQLLHCMIAQALSALPAGSQQKQHSAQLCSGRQPGTTRYNTYDQKAPPLPRLLLHCSPVNNRADDMMGNHTSGMNAFLRLIFQAGRMANERLYKNKIK
jgi:hypothetical protein